MSTTRSTRAAATRSSRADTIALACHVNPDGDALGSMLGLLPRAARRRARRRRVVPEPFVVAPHYRELPGPRPAHPARRLPRRARRDGHVRLRLARPPRRPRARGQGRARARSSSTTTSRTTATARSTSSIPTRRRAACSCAGSSTSSASRSTDDAAVCLYAALVCDTGRFQYETTTPEVFDLARELVEFDVPDRPPVARTLFEEHRFAYLKLLGEALAARRARRRAALRVDRGHPGRCSQRHDVHARGGRGPHRHPAPHHRGRGHVRAQGGGRRHRAGEPAVARRRRRPPHRRGRTAAAATASPPASESTARHRRRRRRASATAL